MKGDKLVSVVVPTYQDEDYLPRALESISDQTYDEIEAIIVDSADSKTVRSIASEYVFAQYVYCEPKGPAAARNIGIDEANGEYIAFLDTDDMWLPTKTENQIQQIERTGADFIYCDQYKTQEGNSTDYDDRSSWEFHKGTCIDNIKHPHVEFFRKGGYGIGSRTVLARRHCFAQERFWEELQLREDPNLWTRLLTEFEPTKVDGAFAVKFHRIDSITDNSKLMYECKIQSVKMLANRYPELKPFVPYRIHEAKYTLSIQLLQNGQRDQARQYLKQLLYSNYGTIFKYKSALVYMLSFTETIQIALPAIRIWKKKGFKNLMREFLRFCIEY